MVFIDLGCLVLSVKLKDCRMAGRQSEDIISVYYPHDPVGSKTETDLVMRTDLRVIGENHQIWQLSKLLHSNSCQSA